MSLTSHLKDLSSPIRRFFVDNFPDTKSTVSETKAKLRGSQLLLPSAWSGRYPYNTVGTAFDYRVRYYFGTSSPADLVAWEGAERAFGPLSLDSEFPVVDRKTGEMLSEISPQAQVAAEFFEALDLTLKSIIVPGRRLDDQDEQMIARYCYALALYEEYYRSGYINPRLESAAHVSDLLSIAPPIVLDDLTALSHAFYDNFASWLSLPAVLNPKFDGSRDVGGADADLIVASDLIDIKTTKNPGLDPLWLYQLLGYVLLDYSDQWEIKGVSIYFSRQVTVVRWSVEELMGRLSGGSTYSLQDWRMQFRAVAESHNKRMRR